MVSIGYFEKKNNKPVFSIGSYSSVSDFWQEMKKVERKPYRALVLGITTKAQKKAIYEKT